MVSISRSIFLACGTMDIEQPMMHVRLYREGGRYMESADIKKGKRKRRRRRRRNGKGKENAYTIADEQPSTLGVPDFKKGLGLQESIEVITKHSTERIHQWPLWPQDGHGQLCDCCFIILVFTQHYMPTQGAQLYKLCLQLGGQVLCFLLGAGHEIFLILNKPLSCSDSLFKVFQLPLRKFKSLGARRCISLGIQSCLLVVDYSAPFGNIGFQGGL
jgi:hypothetical protein